jgi:hypothetical protein
VEQGIIRTGIDIAPKSFEKNVIGSDGKLVSTQTKVYGEKIPLKDIILSEPNRLHAAGIPFPGASLDFNDFRLYFVANFVQFTTAFLGFFFISSKKVSLSKQ